MTHATEANQKRGRDESEESANGNSDHAKRLKASSAPAASSSSDLGSASSENDAKAPTPPASSASTGTELIAASTSSAPSPAQRCHTDTLHCIFAFLSLAELLAAMQSCRGWHAAGVKVPPRGHRLQLSPISIASLVSSSLRRHVAELTFQADSPLRIDQMRMLHALPQLTSLAVTLDGADLENQLQSADDSPEEAAQLVRSAMPPWLCSLTLWCDGSAPARQALVDALPALVDLRTLHFGASISDSDLSPLLQLPLLSDLRLKDQLSLRQCAVIKQLAGLTALDCGRNWKRSTLLQLLRPPHALRQLQQFSLISESVDPPLLSALLQLPALSDLRPKQIKPECWAGLGGLTGLRSLRLVCRDDFSAAQQSSLADSLMALPLLSELRLYLHLNSLADGPSIPLLQLPALCSLTLSSVRVQSLAFLQHSPLLLRLLLFTCAVADAEDTVRCLQSYAPQLMCLTLSQSVRLSEEQAMQLRPPSTLLPALLSFDYDPPAAIAM